VCTLHFEKKFLKKTTLKAIMAKKLRFSERKNGFLASFLSIKTADFNVKNALK
jgi:hypothetical protein